MFGSLAWRFVWLRHLLKVNLVCLHRGCRRQPLGRERGPAGGALQVFVELPALLLVPLLRVRVRVRYDYYDYGDYADDDYYHLPTTTDYPLPTTHHLLFTTY